MTAHPDTHRPARRGRRAGRPGRRAGGRERRTTAAIMVVALCGALSAGCGGSARTPGSAVVSGGGGSSAARPGAGPGTDGSVGAITEQELSEVEGLVSDAESAVSDAEPVP